MNGIISRREGGSVGLELMKFTLTYDGELPSKGDKRQKWEIRQHLHPQLEELWKIEPALIYAYEHRYMPVGREVTISHRHHSDNDRDAAPKTLEEPHIDLCAPIQKAGRSFIPLVRNSYSLRCGLKIQFLRKKPPGRVYQGGDLDNRIKTLFDALQIPDEQQIVEDAVDNSPIYGLLEDDALIASCEINTHRLLSKPNGSVHDVRFVVEVDVRVTNVRIYNQFFLGD